MQFYLGHAAALFAQEWVIVREYSPPYRHVFRSEKAPGSRWNKKPRHQQEQGLASMRTSDLGFHPVQNQNPPIPLKSYVF